MPKKYGKRHVAQPDGHTKTAGPAACHVESNKNMEKLYLETAFGRVPLSAKTVDQYHLEKGMLSPFTGQRIVGADGDAARRPEGQSAAAVRDRETGTRPDVELTTSEILDFANGEDSDPSHQ